MPRARIIRPVSADSCRGGFFPLLGASVVHVSDMPAWVPPFLICQHHFVISPFFHGDPLNISFQSLRGSSHL